MPGAPLDPELVARHYSAFARPGRVLLTGHSHQAWPDVARAALVASFDDAAQLVDDKWGEAFNRAERVRVAVSERIGGTPDRVALGASTHELVTRFLSALDLRNKRHLVTTSGEFHSLDRQLRRLAEAGVEVTFVAARPVASLVERLIAALRPDTAAVLTSTVLFETSEIVPGVAELGRAVAGRECELLLDAYHAFNVVPFSVDDAPHAFWVAGGYKYAQWGEGVCFLLVPQGTELRPVITGWFSDFAHLDGARGAGPVGYGPTLAERFAGSTYDPASHYRAAAVADFQRGAGLNVGPLRDLSLRQTAQLIDGLPATALLTPREDSARAGFVALSVADAAHIVHTLRSHSIFADARGTVLRLGPAPYVTHEQIERALAVIAPLLTRSARAV